MKITKTFLLLLVLLCSACASPTQVEPDSGPSEEFVLFAPALPERFKPGDVLSLSSAGNRTSESFLLHEDGLLRISWNQTGGDSLTLAMQSTEDEGERIQFAFQATDEAGSGDWTFRAGEYVVEVEAPDSSWSVTIEFVAFMDAPDWENFLFQDQD